MSLVAGCGQSPSSPSLASGTSTAPVEAAVRAAMVRAMNQAALGATGNPTNGFTVPCDNGGSMVMTTDPLSQKPPNVFGATMRIEFIDCTHETVTLNGDPYLSMTIQSSYPMGFGTGGETVLTIQTTGGVRLASNGVQGRAQFNCSSTATTTAANTPSAQVTMTSTGSVTFEQPLGTTPVVRPCGPGITG